ncbi:MAG: DNA repair protein RecN, partial [Thermoleophilaceae bacterium]
ERCRASRQELERAEVESGRVKAELAQADSERRGLADQVSAARRKAAPRLAEQVRGELSSLAMEDAAFSVVLEGRPELGPSGAERAEFLLAVNPGVPPAPVREAASGGELSRVMLALMTVAGAAGAPTLAFDEVDAGVGGQTARAVGERLRALASGRQVLCITHLPQIAALGESHFRVEKSTAGELALARVQALDGPDVVEELCRMLGAEASDAGARRHAQELLAAA